MMAINAILINNKMDPIILCLITFLMVFSPSYGTELNAPIVSETGYTGLYLYQAPDGNFFTTGKVSVVGTPGAYDAFLVKTDISGNVLWTKTYNQEQEDCGNSLVQTLDNGFAIIGYAKSATSTNGLIIKTDGNGNSQWIFTYGGANTCYGVGIKVALDGSLIFGGYSKAGAGSFDFWVADVNIHGVQQWSYTYGGATDEVCNQLLQKADGTYVLIGYRNSASPPDCSIYLVKIDSSGARSWEKTFIGAKNDAPMSIVELEDGGLAFVAKSFSVGTGDSDVWFMKTDLAGATVLETKYGGTDNDVPVNLVLTEDNKFAIAATRTSGANTNIYLVESDQSGTVIWERTIANTAYTANYMTAIMDGGLALITDNSGIATLITINCDNGTYIDNTGCHPCPIGTYSVLTNKPLCTSCGAGKYNPSTGGNALSRCISCAQGAFSTADITNTCELCPSGTYNPSEGATSSLGCIPCPAGSYGPYAGGPNITSCISCPAGRYNPNSGSMDIADCYTCPIGLYNPGMEAVRLSRCLPFSCPPGRYNPNTGSRGVDDCLYCPEGTYSNVTGSISIDNCYPCPIGKYNPNIGSNTPLDCVFCPIGTYNNVTGQGSCFPCPAGSYSSREGLKNYTECTSCPAGTYNPTEGATNVTSCLSCPVGTYNIHLRSDNISICEPCPAGTYGPNEGATFYTDCVLCPAGLYNPNNGSGNVSACLPCSVGNYTSTDGAFACSKCPNWLYTVDEGLVECSLCPIGMYAPNATSCLKCPDGSTTIETNSTKCEECFGGDCTGDANLGAWLGSWLGGALVIGVISFIIYKLKARASQVAQDSLVEVIPKNSPDGSEMCLKSRGVSGDASGYDIESPRTKGGKKLHQEQISRPDTPMTIPDMAAMPSIMPGSEIPGGISVFSIPAVVPIVVSTMMPPAQVMVPASGIPVVTLGATSEVSPVNPSAIAGTAPPLLPSLAALGGGVGPALMNPAMVGVAPQGGQQLGIIAPPPPQQVIKPISIDGLLDEIGDTAKQPEEKDKRVHGEVLLQPCGHIVVLKEGGELFDICPQCKREVVNYTKLL